MSNVQRERTLVILKPDALQRALAGEIIERFERTGLRLVALKMTFAVEDLLWKHYNKDEAWYQSKGELTIKNREALKLPIEKEAKEYGRDIIKALVSFMSCGPVVPMVWEGNQAVNIVKKITGGTEPATSDVGTIRGDFTIDSYELSNLDGRAVRNLVHCSDKPEEAEREIELWFKSDEILKYNLALDKILYDVNLDGIKE